MKIHRSLLVVSSVLICALPKFIVGETRAAPRVMKAQPDRKPVEAQSTGSGLPPGTPKIWEDRGKLTPSKVYWGPASRMRAPLSRVPAPPFTNFEKEEEDPRARSPKAKVIDGKGVKWTAKFGRGEAHADIAAPRLAWALGFGTVESYFVKSGRIEGVNSQTDLGQAKQWIHSDGTFDRGARFKRRDDGELQDAKARDITWNLAHNPGVPPEHLSGLLIFNVMVHNWDARTKNCKVLHVETPAGPQNWFIISDLGASFADRRHKFVLRDYQKEVSFIEAVSGDHVELKFNASRSQVRLHSRIPLAHAKWFRKQLAKLTDDQIQAGFDAAFATDSLNRAYASGNSAQISTVRQIELPFETREEISGFVAKFRTKIEEFLQKIPPG